MDTPEVKSSQAEEVSPTRYEKPRIEWEQELDVRTLSIACGKQDPLGIPTCASGVGS